MPKLTQKQIDQIKRRLPQIRGDESQKAFARRLGISQQRLNYIETHQPPSLDFYLPLVRAGYSIDWLLTGRGPMRLEEGQPETHHQLFTSPYAAFYDFLANPSLSGSATWEELRSLDSLRFRGKAPDKHFYYRRLLQLRKHKRARTKTSR